MKRYHYLFLILSLFLASCGKVVQESTQKKDSPIFRLTHTVAVVTKNATVNDFFIEKPLYCAVFAYDIDGKATELSWGEGRVIPKEIKMEGKPSVKTYSSKTLNKKGVELTSADHTWTKVDLKSSATKSEWFVESVELRRGSFGYLVCAFTDTTHYRLKWISKTDVSDNVSIELKNIELYDTFLSILRLMRIQDGDSRMSYDAQFKTLFNEEFFKSLSYQLPPNNALDFNPKKPTFMFDSLLEKTLISVWELYTVDPKDAIDYLKAVKPEILPETSKTLLLKTIKGSAPTPSS